MRRTPVLPEYAGSTGVPLSTPLIQPRLDQRQL